MEQLDLDLGEPETVLDEAKKLIYGGREKQYGPPKKSLTRIADFWQMYLYHKYGFTAELNAEDVCWMMTQLKMCREFNGCKRDSLTDAAGYIGLIERVRSGI
jgi:hypothetical protein